MQHAAVSVLALALPKGGAQSHNARVHHFRLHLYQIEIQMQRQRERGEKGREKRERVTKLKENCVPYAEYPVHRIYIEEHLTIVLQYIRHSVLFGPFFVHRWDSIASYITCTIRY